MGEVGGGGYITAIPCAEARGAARRPPVCIGQPAPESYLAQDTSCAEVEKPSLKT